MHHSNIRHAFQTLAPFILGAVVALVAVNVVVDAKGLPEYGTWTGIRPLEEKLRKLERFTADEPVDAVVLGSSISDFGFSAELLSERLTAANGTPYRVFNFSTGATELVTMPKLYRLMRTVAKPKTLLLLVPPGIKRSNILEPVSPDYIMGQAPIRRGLEHPWLLPYERHFWEVPMIRYGSALRDLLLFRGYVNLPGQGSDLYRINDFGDTLSFSYQTSRADLQYTRGLFKEQLSPLTDEQMTTLDQRQKLAHYFNDLDIAAIAELRAFAASDELDLVVVAHNPAATFFPKPILTDRYVRARRQFYRILADELDARLVNKIEDFSAPLSSITDTVHLNRYGAETFTGLVADDLTGSQTAPVQPPRHPKLVDIPSEDVTVTAFAALIEAPKGKHERRLRLRLLQNQATPALPPGPLSLMLRLPDETDLVAPARFTSGDTLEATFDDVPTGSNELFLVRVVADIGGRVTALNEPVGHYAWIDE